MTENLKAQLVPKTHQKTKAHDAIDSLPLETRSNPELNGFYHISGLFIEQHDWM